MGINVINRDTFIHFYLKGIKNIDFGAVSLSIM